MKHTPGPWAVMRRFRDYIVPASDAEKKLGGASDPKVEAADFAKTIAKVEGTIYTDFHMSRVIAGDEQDANAHLIAAAPDLLVALRRLGEIAWQSEPYIYDENTEEEEAIRRRLNVAIKLAQEAIAKAEGRTG